MDRVQQAIQQYKEEGGKYWMKRVMHHFEMKKKLITEINKTNYLLDALLSDTGKTSLTMFTLLTLPKLLRGILSSTLKTVGIA